MDFTAEMRSFPKQLDVSYHGDRFSRDQLLTDVYLPDIYVMVQNRIPRTSEHAMILVGDHLSDEKGTARTTCDIWVSEPIDRDKNDFQARAAYYTLWQMYKREAQRLVKG